MSPTNPRRVAYLLKTFPRLSETFILNEILGLESLGMELDIFSLKRPEEQHAHAAVASVKAAVTYVPSLLPNPLNLLRCLAAHLALLLWNPVRYWKTLAFFLGEQKSRIKEFAQAGFLARCLQRRAIVHLHAHFANVPTSVAELAHRFTGISYSFTAHAKDIYLTPRGELRRKIQSATFVLTCTGFNAKHLFELSDGQTPIRMVYHGVDLRVFQPASSPRSANSVPVIVSVGRFCEKKGLSYLIQACALLKEQGRQFRCRIIGYGELRDQLSSLISQSGLAGSVSLEGPLTQNQVIEVYRAADMFVLPCLVTDNGDRDGIPNVLLEAMTMGIPVISTGISGIVELIDHMGNGILVPERDAQEVAHAICLLLDQPKVAARLAASGREKVLGQFELRQSARAVLGSFEEHRFSPSAWLTGSVETVELPCR